MSGQQIIEDLIARNERVTEQFFFGSCRPLFLSIIHHVFAYDVDYDEFVNEFYLHLMENDAYRLKQFQGRSTVYQWLKVIAIRYFIAKRACLIDNESKDTLSDSSVQNITVDDERRYVFVIRRLVLQEAEPKIVARELKTNVDNLYNIKKRAIARLTEIALKEIEKYEKEISK